MSSSGDNNPFRVVVDDGSGSSAAEEFLTPPLSSPLSSMAKKRVSLSPLPDQTITIPAPNDSIPTESFGQDVDCLSVSEGREADEDTYGSLGRLGHFPDNLTGEHPLSSSDSDDELNGQVDASALQSAIPQRLMTALPNRRASSRNVIPLDPSLLQQNESSAEASPRSPTVGTPPRGPKRNIAKPPKAGGASSERRASLNLKTLQTLDMSSTTSDFPMEPMSPQRRGKITQMRRVEHGDHSERGTVDFFQSAHRRASVCSSTGVTSPRKGLDDSHSDKDELDSSSPAVLVRCATEPDARKALTSVAGKGASPPSANSSAQSSPITQFSSVGSPPSSIPTAFGSPPIASAIPTVFALPPSEGSAKPSTSSTDNRKNTSPSTPGGASTPSTSAPTTPTTTPSTPTTAQAFASPTTAQAFASPTASSPSAPVTVPVPDPNSQQPQPTIDPENETELSKILAAKEIVDNDLETYIAACNAQLAEPEIEPERRDVVHKAKRLAQEALGLSSDQITQELWQNLVDRTEEKQNLWCFDWERQNVVTKLLFILSRLSRLLAAIEESREVQKEISEEKPKTEEEESEETPPVSPRKGKVGKLKNLLSDLKSTIRKGSKSLSPKLSPNRDPGSPSISEDGVLPHEAASSLPQKMVMCRVCEDFVSQSILKEHSNYCGDLIKFDMNVKFLDNKLKLLAKEIVRQINDVDEEEAPVVDILHQVSLQAAGFASDRNGLHLTTEMLMRVKEQLKTSEVRDSRIRDKAHNLADLLSQKTEGIENYLLVWEQMHSLGLTPQRSEVSDVSKDQRLRRPSSAYHRTQITDFEILKPISRGAFGRVYLARKTQTGDLYAVKVLKKSEMKIKNKVEQVNSEKKILAEVSNSFIVRLFFTFQSRDKLFLVMEYLNGGDLFSLLANIGQMHEDMARVYTAEIVMALEYLHERGIVHRDLKPDNVLIGRDGHLKLTDFGLSRSGLMERTPLPNNFEPFKAGKDAPENELDSSNGRQNRRFSLVGTPDYLAPEILLGKGHTVTADWWSLGVILFEFLTGIPPFNDEGPEAIFDNILNRVIPWVDVPEEMSHEADDLIQKLLTLDPNQRLGANGSAEVKSHPFFEGINWETLRSQPAVFLPSVDDEGDTSYFEDMRQGFDIDHDFDDSSDEERKKKKKDQLGVSMTFRDREFLDFTFKNISNLQAKNEEIALKGESDDPF